MERKFDPALERVIHQELKKLPTVKAPDRLKARVLEAVRARQSLPWWQQSFWHWPAPVRAVFLFLVGFIAMSLTGGTWFAGEVASDSTVARTVAEYMSPFTNAFVVMWRSFLQTLALWALALAGVMYLICVGAGTLFVRVAYKRA